MKKKIIILCILLTLIFLILFVIKASNMILKQIYPLKYANYVEKYAKENNLDVMLVYAIIKAESNFEPNITSTSGAMGLMQIMENTAKEIAERNRTFNERSHISTRAKHYAWHNLFCTTFKKL